MAKLPRVTNKRFGSDIELDNIGQFGSAAAGEKTNTKDVAEIQALEAWKQGWTKATMSSNKYPTMQERNGLDYVHAYQIDYLLREGIAEYDSQTEYNANSIVKGIVNNEMKLFSSVLDQNIGQDLTNEHAWKELSFGSGGLEIGDIGFTQMAIDETKGKRRVLNGQLIIQEQYVQFTNIIKNSVALNPSLACTEEEWQTAVTMSAYGLCEKFVIDDEAGTIRLPKYPDYFIGGVDVPTGNIPVAGNATAIGFKQIKDGNTMYGAMCTNSGQAMFYAGCYGQPVGTWRNGSHFDGGTGIGLTTDATKSGVIAKLSNDQTEQIKGTYFIQVATGAETEDNIINEIELNNPYSFGDSKYSPKPLNNLSWLKSEGQWNRKADYPSFYDWALTNFNNGVEGFALSTGDYTDYNVVINTAEETFRLPLLDGSESLPSNKSVGLSIGESGSTYIAPANGWYYLRRVATASGQHATLTAQVASKGVATASGQYLQVFVPVRRGQTVEVSYTAPTAGVFRFVYAQGNGSLYFYVGETVQNANLINAGRIEEKLASIIPDNSSLISGYSMPSNRYIDLTLGASGTEYTAPANGWYYITKNTSGFQYFQFYNLTKKYCDRGTGNSITIAFITPVSKGDIIKVQYNASGTTDIFRFYYAEGSQ